MSLNSFHPTASPATPFNHPGFTPSPLVISFEPAARYPCLQDTFTTVRSIYPDSFAQSWLQTSERKRTAWRGTSLFQPSWTSIQKTQGNVTLSLFLFFPTECAPPLISLAWDRAHIRFRCRGQLNSLVSLARSREVACWRSTTQSAAPQLLMR